MLKAFKEVYFGRGCLLYLAILDSIFFQIDLASEKKWTSDLSSKNREPLLFISSVLSSGSR